MCEAVRIRYETGSDSTRDGDILEIWASRDGWYADRARGSSWETTHLASRWRGKR